LMGITLVGGGSYRGLHEVTANLSLVLIGLHVALHWDWIVNMLRRFVLPSRAAKPELKPALRAEALKGKV
ncbi:MAG TPA: hypothetical protein VFX76_08355, partial [Roseiflexaceae bacterium]|nr:hypothetical protein [Roseiflexaceae bacterium]